MRDGLRPVDIPLQLYTLRCQLKCPGENQCEEKSNDKDQKYKTPNPLGQIQ